MRYYPDICLKGLKKYTKNIKCPSVAVESRTCGMNVQVRTVEPTCSVVESLSRQSVAYLDLNSTPSEHAVKAAGPFVVLLCRSWRLIHTWLRQAGNHVTATRSEGDRDHFMSYQLTEAFRDDVMSLAVSSLLCYRTLIVDNRIVRKSWKDDWLFAVLLYLLTA